MADLRKQTDMVQGKPCTDPTHVERTVRGLCAACAHARHRRHLDKKRAATQGLTWPCIQCGGPIRWTGGNGGNRLTICRECAPTDRYRWLVRRYGVDRAMFEAMYFDQDGKCAINRCTREAACVDHCHTTGRVRGLLCQGCNVAIGFVEDAAWMKAAADYLAA